jgi:hypothetical protein
MACLFQVGIPPFPHAHYFVLDLEAVGNALDPSTCAIWDICLIHYESKRVWQRFVDPQWEMYPPPPKPQFTQVTPTLLREKNAVPFGQCFPELLTFIASFGPRETVILSHGMYVLDKPLLEREISKCGVLVPSNWYFFDTCSWFRQCFRNQKSYSLTNLYGSVFSRPRGTAAHDAHADATTLLELLQQSTTNGPLHGQLVGVAYLPYVTPLQSIRFIGNTTERRLISSGVFSVEDLFRVYIMSCRLQQVPFLQFLHSSNIPPDAAVRILQSVERRLIQNNM